ncbi:zinc finger, C2H2 type [Ancylostoma caninum]|uniref:RING-type E3 ubiquitin transferase n=1 Tax=Ancylostoma caninum TaxID=29170 RepID=A0A368GBD2_ANCCA|nr:zinc finger, C2H2 type [Ancylostoma caninum]
MQKYEQMIDTAKDNFADIALSNGPKEECTICCKDCDLFGVGSCNHPVCIECAIRIRVLSNNRQCSVCRANMETLCFTFVSNGFGTTFAPLRSLNHPDEDRYGLRFENADAITRYEKYLAHVCKLCKSPDGSRLEFPTFVALRHHMSSVHQLTYCHICTENIILFSRERKTYTRDGLQRHIRAGDRDDKSLKGHPSCLFCDQRFFDEEFRYRHLRKEHFFCGFCESEGKHMNVFFKDHGELVAHYKEQHFLCEFEECKAMGIAFSNQMDLNLHKSKEHSNRRAAVGLDFQFSDRQLAGPSRTRREAPTNAPVPRREKIAVVPQEQPAVPKRPTDEFVVVPSAQSSSRTVRYNVAPAYTPQNEDFPSLAPSLGNSRSDPALANLRPVNFPRLNRVNHAGGQQVNSNKPSPISSSQAGGVVQSSHNAQKVSAQPQSSAQPVEDFPALPAVSKQLPATSAWGAKKNAKTVIVGCKVPNNAKQLPQPDVWPDRPVTTPAKEVEPEQWHEVPAKPRKEKKTRRVQQKDSKVVNGETSESKEPHQEPQQAVDLITNESKPETVEGSNGKKRKENSNGNKPSTTVVETKAKGVPAVSDFVPARKEPNKSRPSADKVEPSTPAPNKENEDAVLQEVERYVDESARKATTPSEPPSQSSSILDWFSLPTESSLFSNLSLSNVLGTQEPQKSTIPTQVAPLPPEAVQLPPRKSTSGTVVELSSTNADAPPGFGLSAGSNILSGPPPGFESICPDPSAPPGLAIPRASQPVFSMAPFFSDSDLSRKAALSESEQKRQSEWSTVGAKH